MSKEILNLVPAIRAIEKEIGKLADDYNKRIQPYFDNLEKLIKHVSTVTELVMF